MNIHINNLVLQVLFVIFASLISLSYAVPAGPSIPTPTGPSGTDNLAVDETPMPTSTIYWSSAYADTINSGSDVNGDGLVPVSAVFMAMAVSAKLASWPSIDTLAMASTTTPTATTTSEISFSSTSSGLTSSVFSTSTSISTTISTPGPEPTSPPLSTSTDSPTPDTPTESVQELAPQSTSSVGPDGPHPVPTHELKVIGSVVGAMAFITIMFTVVAQIRMWFSKRALKKAKDEEKLPFWLRASPPGMGGNGSGSGTPSISEKPTHRRDPGRRVKFAEREVAPDPRSRFSITSSNTSHSVSTIVSIERKVSVERTRGGAFKSTAPFLPAFKPAPALLTPAEFFSLPLTTVSNTSISSTISNASQQSQFHTRSHSTPMPDIANPDSQFLRPKSRAKSVSLLFVAPDSEWDIAHAYGAPRLERARSVM